VARSRSSTSSSESFLRDLGIALLALLLVEGLLHQAMAPLEAQNAALNAPPEAAMRIGATVSILVRHGDSE